MRYMVVLMVMFAAAICSPEKSCETVDLKGAPLTVCSR